MTAFSSPFQATIKSIQAISGIVDTTGVSLKDITITAVVVAKSIIVPAGIQGSFSAGATAAQTANFPGTWQLTSTTNAEWNVSTTITNGPTNTIVRAFVVEFN